jgi:hypothetical protein
LEAGGAGAKPGGRAFILIGAEPHTDWLTTIKRDERGFLLTGRDLLPGIWVLG